MLTIRATTLTLETIEQYRSWCIGRAQSPNTVKAYTSDLRMFLKAATTDGTVSMEEYEELAQAWLNMNRAATAPSTTTRRLTSLKSFARWATGQKVLEDYIAPTPGKTIPHPIPEGPEGIRRMLDKARNHEERALVTLGGMVGLRISESLSILTTSIDIEAMQLTVRGKGDKTRVVPISDEAWTNLCPAYVLGLRKPDLRLVSYKDRFAREIITRLGRKAGLRRAVTSHDLRATMATAMHDNGVNLRVVQEVLGHASSQTTEIYTGVSMTQMRKAVDL